MVAMTVNVEHLQNELKQFQRDMRNEARREMRKAVKPLEQRMRAEAPVRTGKLQSSIKAYTDSKFGAGVRYGGKASAPTVKTFLNMYGPPGKRGGSWATSGRIAEAFYHFAISKGHPLPRPRGTSARVPSNKWVNRAVTKTIIPIRRDLERAVERTLAKRNLI